MPVHCVLSLSLALTVSLGVGGGTYFADPLDTADGQEDSWWPKASHLLWGLGSAGRSTLHEDRAGGA